MIADINVTEKSFGPNTLMSGVKFSVGSKEKVGVIGRNGIGKTTLFSILTGADKDFSGDIIYRKGISVVSTAQEHHVSDHQTVLQYILTGLPEYESLSHVIETYPASMGDDMKKIAEYTEALQRFDDKGFYQIEEKVTRELDNFQLPDIAHRPFSSLSGGQKRLVEVVKVMHSEAQLALIDEPTNHMDYVAKAQFIDWLKSASEAMLIITHDRDVLREIDRIVELKDGAAHSYKGNYDDYLRQNAHQTGSAMNEYEVVKRRIDNLKIKVVQFRRLKERARDPDTIKQFKRRESQAAAELFELQQIDKPTFWIDKDSVEALNYKVASQYDKFKAQNIKMKLKSDQSRSSHVLVKAVSLSLGYDKPLFGGVNIDLREGEAAELRGRNGAGKTTLIKALLGRGQDIKNFAGELTLDPQVRVGVYEQEVSPKYFDLGLHDAIERIYLDLGLSVGETKIRQLMSDYLFTDGDSKTPVARLSGGQKARLQIIQMLANDPQLLILDEPTNHLDLPSIEELESALSKYSGAVLYVSHDGYFRQAISGQTIEISRK
ncbi:MAG TPA: ABC-F family ATP-binding cassette domain-containing protein [Candidatus Saccharimonadales bacterium]|nr:ABC-F family ATP-binding cassette domain-containing protein [Candidatus Saccharimonadales bacterium]